MGSHLNFRNWEGSGAKPSVNSPLIRQSSVYSLTFDEFQNTWGGGLGKELGSMNMDELLKNIWTVEETHTTTTNPTSVGEGSLPGGNLQRQGSLTLPRTISQKTVDEVWRGLVKENSGGAKDGSNVASNLPPQTQRQPTLGEMTLEEFLARAGVVREDTQLVGKQNNAGFFDEFSRLNNNNNTGLALGFQQTNRNNELVGTRILENNNNFGAIQHSNLALNGGGIRSSQPQQQQLHQNQQQHQNRPQQQQQQQQNRPQHQLLQSRPPQQQLLQSRPPQEQLHQNQPQQQQQQPLFPKPANVAFASPVHLVNNSQLPSPRVRTSVVGIADQLISNNLVHGGGMSMVGLGNGVTVASGSPANQISPDIISRDTPSLSPVPHLFGRGRKASGALEKVIERRHRRMIKNRESAARSRARKQAYTLELEAEVAKLKEMNQELQKKQAEIMEMQKNQFLEKINRKWGSKRQCLRRTLTGPW